MLKLYILQYHIQTLLSSSLLQLRLVLADTFDLKLDKTITKITAQNKAGTVKFFTIYPVFTSTKDAFISVSLGSYSSLFPSLLQME